jgi:predicted DNA-binding transcriptional regulator AlpA
MSAELADLLRALLADPAKLEGLTPEQEHAVIASLRGTATEVVSAPVIATARDELLTVEEAAGMLRVSPRWLYRHAKTLPFTRKLSPKVLRFSRSGLLRWVASCRT